MTIRNEGPATLPGPLLLRPASDQSRRRWVVDAGSLPAGQFLIPVLPSVQTFGSFDGVLSTLPSVFRTEYSAAIERFEGYVAESRFPAGHGSAGPSIALRRRISRESGPATRAVELGAMLLLHGLRELDARVICVPRVDELDSLSVRLLVRAVLRMSAADDLRFVFHSTSDPRSPMYPGTPASAARQSILSHAVRAGDFQLEVNCASSLPSRSASEPSTAQAAVDLVAHNYEAALLRVADPAPDEAADAARIEALAAINLGDLELADRRLTDALEACTGVATSAHLFCLRALIATKRTGDLDASEHHIEKGLDLLQTGTPDGDFEVERAWLLNARALNRALVFRRTRDERIFREAHELEVEASHLVADGSSPERTYLRFNLLANLALLWEGRGDHLSAARVFERAFAQRTQVDPSGAATLGYRLGVLYAKAGELRSAERVLDGLADELPPEEWPATDHLLRAQERIALRMGEHERAEELATYGMNLCVSARSADGVRSHALALLDALRAGRRPHEAMDVERRLIEFGLDPSGSGSVETLRPKLPAYVPEIDLEDVPSSDTNIRLAGAAR